MKSIYYFLLAGTLAMVSCEPAADVVAPNFNVRPAAESFTLEEGATFEFEGTAGLISFYSGELYHDYEFKDGRIIEAGTFTLSFNTSVQYGNQPDQLSVLVSSDFDGDYSSIENVRAATWSDITDRFALATNATYVESGAVDITEFLVEDKPLYIAFKYTMRDKTVHGNPRQWRINNFLLTSETSIGTTVLADYLTAGFEVVDLNPDGVAPTNSLYNLNNFLRMAAFTVTPENEHVLETEVWAITKAFYGGAVDMGPDRPIAVKGNTDQRLSSYTYIYEKPGTYTAHFVAANANVYGKEEAVKKVTVTIEP